jgi:hypothetical protein
MYWKLIREGALWVIERYRLRRAPADTDGTLLRNLRASNSSQGGGSIPAFSHAAEEGASPNSSRGSGGILASSHTAEEGAIRYIRKAYRYLASNPIALPGVPEGDNSTSSRIRRRLKGFWQNLENIWTNLVQTLLGFIFSGTIFILIAAAATAVIHLELDNAALLASPTCGLWLGPEGGSWPNTGLYALSKTEEQTALYYRNCYEADSPQECSLFLDKKLYWKMTDNDECPFQGDVCLLGNNSALTFDTGYVDTKQLGLNLPQARRPYFRRRTSCAPVATIGYIESKVRGLYTHTRYFYGPDTAGHEHTWNEIQVDWDHSFGANTYQVVGRSEGQLGY